MPDWLLGGKVRRRVIERLADDDGWTADALATSLEANRAWVFELFRALRNLEAIKSLGEGRYALDKQAPVGSALNTLLKAAAPYANEKVERPPGRIRQLSD